jgi:hypothetical protein
VVSIVKLWNVIFVQAKTYKSEILLKGSFSTIK